MLVPSEIHLDTSLMNITDNNGPKIDPCGTPDLTGKTPDLTPPCYINLFWFNKAMVRANRMSTKTLENGAVA